MDSISGGPFFHYIFSYFWIWMIVQGMKRFVFSKSIWFLLMISLISVLIEHIFLVLSVFSLHGKIILTGLNFGQMAWQIVSAVIIIPVALWMLNIIFQNYVFISKRMMTNFRRI
jgi:rod shape-determining protein MreD